jgi:sulfite reductase alpha subunit-like flavoprotein
MTDIFILMLNIEMEASSAPTWLYFGCRHKDRDYLYKSQLGKFLQ